jgi:hypothetical protein
LLPPDRRPYGLESGSGMIDLSTPKNRLPLARTISCFILIFTKTVKDSERILV